MSSEKTLLEQAVDYDQATMAQVERIQKEIVESAPLVGEREDLSSLEKEYAQDDVIYQAKIQDLQSRYSKLRRTRGDGNCFFRAFAFGYMESLLHDRSDLARFCDAINKQKSLLLAMGYPTFTLEDFHESFIDTLEEVTKPSATVQNLTEGNSQFFQEFVEGGRSMKEYCSQEVEPMYRESDHMHITALTMALGVPVRVEYMDRGEGGKVNHHDFPEGSDPVIHILYRPGHYDLLYS